MAKSIFEQMVTNRRVPRCCCPPGPCCRNIQRVEIVVSMTYDCFVSVGGEFGLPVCTTTVAGSGGGTLAWTLEAQAVVVSEATIGECVVGVSALKTFDVAMRTTYGGDPECWRFSTNKTEEYEVTTSLELDCDGVGTGSVTVTGPKLGTGVLLELIFSGYSEGAEGQPATVTDSDSDSQPSSGCDSGSTVVSATVTVEAAAPTG